MAAAAAAQAAAQAAGAVANSRLVVPRLESRTEFDSWKWQLGGVLDGLNLKAQFETAVSQEGGQIELSEEQERSYRAFEATLSNALSGEALQLISGAQCRGLVEAVRLLQSVWDQSTQLEQSALFAEITSAVYDWKVHGPIDVYAQMRWSQCPKLTQLPPTPPSRESLMYHVLSYRLGPDFEPVMSTLRSEKGLSWREALLRVIDFQKSKQLVRSQTQGQIFNTVENANPSNAENTNANAQTTAADGEHRQLIKVLKTVIKQNSKKGGKGGKGMGKHGHGGKGKYGGGKNFKTCNYCGWQGHTAKYCFDRLGSKGKKGKGEGKKGGNGNGNGKNNNCHERDFDQDVVLGEISLISSEIFLQSLSIEDFYVASVSSATENVLDSGSSHFVSRHETDFISIDRKRRVSVKA